MEVFGAFLDQEWESLSNMFSFEDSSDHFLLASADIENAADINGCDYNINNYNNNNDNSLFFPCDHAVDQNTDQFYFAGRPDGDISFRAADYGGGGGGDFFHDEKMSSAFEPMDFIVPTVFSDYGMADEILQLKAEMGGGKLGSAAGSQTAENGDDSFVGMQLKRKLETPDNLPESPKKVCRVSRESNKSKRNTPRTKKSKKLEVQIISNGEETNNHAGGNRQSPSTCSSEEGESNNEIINGGGSSSPDSKVSTSNGKSKAGKGPATDPQSIYARKRRERINERLKTLQTLVPNGTKVDISTMLEEAVDYVKFLQLQIKLLSSDDMWMFAPIAYNGMDMGLYQKISN